MIPLTARVLHAASAESVDGVGAVVDLGLLFLSPRLPDNTLRLTLDVSIAGPALTVIIDTSDDQSTWLELEAFDAVAEVASVFKVVQPCKRYVRARWSLDGAGSTTFSLSGVSLRPYATVAQLRGKGNIARAFADVSDEVLERELATASTRADDILVDARYVPPLVAWDDSLSDDVMSIAVWNIMTEIVGYNPELGRDDVIKMRFDTAIKNLGRGSYSGIIDSTVETDEGEAYVVSDGLPNRWARTRRC